MAQPPEPYAVKRRPDRRINAMIYGASGAGKTTLAATAQANKEMADVLFLNFEGGLLSVEDLDLPEGIGAVDITGPEALDEIFWVLHKSRSQPDHPYARFKTVVIDSGSELATRWLERTTLAAAERIEKLASGDSKKRDMDIATRLRDGSLIRQEDYGTQTRQMARLLRMFRDMDMSVIITAFERFEYPRNKDNAPPNACGPEFAQRLAKHLKGYMDFVWYLYEAELEEGKTVRRLLTQPHGIFFAKTRGHRFSEAIGKVIDWSSPDVPLLSQLFDKLQQSNEETKT